MRRYLHSGNFREVLGRRFAGSTFYAACERISGGTEPWPPLGPIAAIFRLPGSEDRGFTTGIEGGKAVNLTFGCGASPAQIAELVEPVS